MTIFRAIKLYWRHTLRIRLHRKHKWDGVQLKRIDPTSYPYCTICGVSPKGNYEFKWFYKDHVEARNALRGMKDVVE